jgi:hypothetical protein
MGKGTKGKTKQGIKRKTMTMSRKKLNKWMAGWMDGRMDGWMRMNE